MKPVQRSAVLDYVTYNEQRAELRPRFRAIKNARRVYLGDHLMFLFENTNTMLYQVQEMMRAEQIVKESAIQHEIDTHNELLGGPGVLTATLLIGIDDVDRREVLLTEWIDLPKHIYVKLDGGDKVYCAYDHDQVGRGRLSSVQYITFDTGGRVPVAIGTDLGPLNGEVELTEAQRSTFADDLA